MLRHVRSVIATRERFVRRKTGACWRSRTQLLWWEVATIGLGGEAIGTTHNVEGPPVR